MKFRCIGLLLGLAMLTVAAAAQNNELPDSFYPTKSMVRAFVDQFTEQMGRQLQLDEQQLDTLRASYYERVSTYLVAQRADVEPVLNGFIGMWSERQAPQPEKIAEWAQKAGPVIEGIKGTILETAEEFRPNLSDEQNTLLDGNIAAFNVGSNFMQTKIQTWADGGFDAEREWHRSPGHREAARAEEKEVRAEQEYAAALARNDPNPPIPAHWRTEGDAGAAVAGGHPIATTAAGDGGPGGEQVVMGTPTGNFDGGEAGVVQPGAANPAAARTAQPASAADPWAADVEAFCAKYKLNPEQRAAAERILREAARQRDEWLQKKSHERTALENALKSPKLTEKGRADYAARLKKLDDGVNGIRRRMTERLEKIPTRAQREQASAKPDVSANTAAPLPVAGGPR